MLVESTNNQIRNKIKSFRWKKKLLGFWYIREANEIREQEGMVMLSNIPLERCC